LTRITSTFVNTLTQFNPYAEPSLFMGKILKSNDLDNPQQLDESKKKDKPDPIEQANDAPAVRKAKKDGRIKAVSEENFQQDVIKASYEFPVIVDVWATWCHACKELTPILENYVTGKKGAIKLAEVDLEYKIPATVNSEIRKPIPRTPDEMGLPSVLVYWQGAVVRRFKGFSKEQKFPGEQRKALDTIDDILNNLPKEK
jgi:thioredoxin-like negative regulator of GroEL